MCEEQAKNINVFIQFIKLDCPATPIDNFKLPIAAPPPPLNDQNLTESEVYYLSTSSASLQPRRKSLDATQSAIVNMTFTKTGLVNAQYPFDTYIINCKFPNYDQRFGFQLFLHRQFFEIMKKLVKRVKQTDLVGLKLTPNVSQMSVATIPSIQLSYRPFSEITVEAILHTIAAATVPFPFGEPFIFHLTALRLPRENVEESLQTTYAYLKSQKENIADPGIRFNDKMISLPKSILLRKAYADHDFFLFKKYNQQDNIQLHRAAEALQAETNVGENNVISKIKEMQRIMCDYQIKVYSNRTNGNVHLFKGPVRQKKIHLFYVTNLDHFVALLNVKAFFKCSYKCSCCGYVKNDKLFHDCPEKCNGCKSKQKCQPDDEAKIRCSDCSRDFVSFTCFTLHLVNLRFGRTICQTLFKCDKCLNMVDLKDGRSEHACGFIFCNQCERTRPTVHTCFVTRHNKPTLQKWLIVFFNFDFDASLAVKLCVTQMVCEKCYFNEDATTKCKQCGISENYFHNIIGGDNCVDRFLNHIDVLHTTGNRPIFCVTHNLRYLNCLFRALSRRTVDVKIKMNGPHIELISYHNNRVKIMDSVNFFNVPLSKYSETFALTECCSEQYYTYLFNRTDAAKGAPRSAVPLAYKLSLSVTILRQGCLKFMDILNGVLNIYPFLESSTMRELLMFGYRKTTLTDNNSLSIVPTSLYTLRRNYSLLADKWFAHVRCEIGNDDDDDPIIFEHKIDYALVVSGYRLKSRMVYEFLECFANGCLKCFKNRRIDNHCFGGVPIEQLSLDERLTAIREKHQKLTELNLTVSVMWECDFRRFLKRYPEAHQKLNGLPEIRQSKLNYKDAIYPGIAEVCRRYYITRPGGNERIRCFRFRSLYAHVMKTCCYPIGVPTVFAQRECSALDITKTDGFIKCQILPPKNLFHPVLPIKLCDGRVVMTLCQSCAEQPTPLISYCKHSDAERTLSGTWVLAEVHLAIEMGYVMGDIYEVWQYSVSNRFFDTWINTFLKFKTETSGWPLDDMTDMEKTEYIARLITNEENLELTAENFAKNDAFRSLFDDILAGSWQAFNQSYTQSSVIGTFDELVLLISSSAIEVYDIYPWSDTSVLVNWRFKNEDHWEGQLNRVVSVGAFIAAYARIRMYREVLSRLTYVNAELKANVTLFYDTDHIYFIETPTKRSELPIGGSGIGELENALLPYGPNVYIIKFEAVDSQRYSYTVFDPDTGKMYQIVKSNGIEAKLMTSNVLFHFAERRDSEYEKRRKIDNDVGVMGRFNVADYFTVPYGYRILYTYTDSNETLVQK